MSERRGWNGLRAVAIAAAALALAGCAADYVGEDWQCPLAQGSVCASVAAADPAVPESRGRGTRAAETYRPAAPTTANRPGDAPPFRPRTEGATTGSPDERDCASGCNPLAWLAGLFPVSDGGAGSGERVDDAAGQAGIEPADPASVDTPAPETSGVAAADIATAERVTNGVPASLPDSDDGIAAAAVAAPLPARDVVRNDTLRVPETVARVWIAPWVDADGIYREGSYVRAVIAPAEWRPR